MDGVVADKSRLRRKQTSPSVGIDRLFNVTERESQPVLFVCRRSKHE